MRKNQQNTLKNYAGSVSRRHHFATQNTAEIILCLILIGAVTQLLEFISRDAKY